VRKEIVNFPTSKLNNILEDILIMNEIIVCISNEVTGGNLTFGKKI
jgi:hypothetical protein